METSTTKTAMLFLQKGGELGELTRNYDWATTGLGSPDQWPQSLCATVGIVLHSAFPMFLFWGKDLFCFYNDAFRPSLGQDGKHPAIGKKGFDVWPEIWNFIGPLIEKVIVTGESVWFEDQLVPFFRNGKVEDIYWTFSYSPAYGDTGTIEGVIVTCTETTGKIKTLQELETSKRLFEESERSLRNMLWQAPVAISLLKGPEFIVEITNEKALELRGKTKEEMYGKPVFEVLPEAKEQGFEELVNRVYYTGETCTVYGKKLSLVRNGKIETIYVSFSYEPYREADGTITGVLSVANDVTAEFMARQYLTESEQRFRTMAEGTEILIAISDETSNATYFNKAWTELTGRSMDDLLNFGWADLIHPQDREDFVKLYLGMFEKHLPWSGEFRVRNKQGNYRWLLAKGTVRSGADGAFSGYISSSIDITERMDAVTAFQESEQEIRSLVEGAPFPIGVYKGKEMRIAFANQAIIDVWGKGNDVIGKLYSEILPELTNQQIFDQLDEVFTTGRPFHMKNQRLELVIDGRLQSYYFNYSFTPLLDAEGNVYGVMNTAAEVTDLNVAKQKAEQSERNFRTMVLQAPVAMCILLGPEHTIAVANQLMLEIWGKPSAEVMDKPVFEGLPDAKGQGLEQVMNEVYRNGETFMANERPVELVRNGKKETVFQNFVYEPYKDSDDTILGILAISIDVTAQVLARQKIEEIVSDRTKELATANSNLQKSNAELAQFAYIASHDLQEPLRKISTYTQMLESRVNDSIDEQARGYLQKINNSSQRMNALIRDVLSYSELVKENETFVDVDLQEIIQSVLTDYELMIDEKKAIINFEKLPVIEAIPLQMSQLFGNLIGNSLKFARKDLRPVINMAYSKVDEAEKLQLNLEPEVSYFKIKVADNGIGFKEEFTEQIFNIFQRLHRKSDYEGTGIGLAMCKKIALNHHGNLNAKGSSESGAVFNIVLPIVQLKEQNSLAAG